MAKIEIKSKDRKFRGRDYPGQASGMFAEITGKTIHITGHYSRRDVDIKFSVGDTVIYDSWNLYYLGKIVKITDKRITIKPEYSERNKSLDLHTFATRNYNLDLERVLAENHETSYYI